MYDKEIVMSSLQKIGMAIDTIIERASVVDNLTIEYTCPCESNLVGAFFFSFA